MSLQLKFDICVTNGCTQIRFSETTGYYSSVNTTGWGSPNWLLADALTAKLDITTPSGTTYTINLLTTTLFPSNVVGTLYDIPSSSIGGITSIVDGQWIFKYYVTNKDDVEVSTTIYKYFYCNSECCVTEMLANLDLSCDCCKDSDSYKNYTLAWTELQSLKKAAACGDSTNFTTIKKIVDKLCKNNGCKTCK